MQKFILFIVMLVKEVEKDELISLANEVSYKILLAIFPLIIFILTILGFLNIDSSELIQYLSRSIPQDILVIVETLINEVVGKKSIGLLSTSFIFTIYSASSGFNAVIRAINKSYGQKETRNFIVVRLISVFLVILFSLSIVLSVAGVIAKSSFVLREKIIQMFPEFSAFFFSFTAVLISLAMLLINTMVIYKVSSCKKVSFIKVLPGALCTVVFWAILTKAFNLYIVYFSSYSKIYGSIGSVMILMIWLNIISIVLLLGSEINALLEIRN